MIANGLESGPRFTANDAGCRSWAPLFRPEHEFLSMNTFEGLSG